MHAVGQDLLGELTGENALSLALPTASGLPAECAADDSQRSRVFKQVVTEDVIFGVFEEPLGLGEQALPERPEEVLVGKGGIAIATEEDAKPVHEPEGERIGTPAGLVPIERMPGDPVQDSVPGVGIVQCPEPFEVVQVKLPQQRKAVGSPLGRPSGVGRVVEERKTPAPDIFGRVVLWTGGQGEQVDGRQCGGRGGHGKASAPSAGIAEAVSQTLRALSDDLTPTQVSNRVAQKLSCLQGMRHLWPATPALGPRHVSLFPTSACHGDGGSRSSGFNSQDRDSTEPFVSRKRRSASATRHAPQAHGSRAIRKEGTSRIRTCAGSMPCERIRGEGRRK